MVYCYIDNMEFPVAVAAGRDTYEDIGFFGRSLSGVAINAVRGSKWSKEIRTPPMSREALEQYRAMLEARGVYLRFAADPDQASSGYLLESVSGHVQGDLVDNAGRRINDAPFGHFVAPYRTDGVGSIEINDVAANLLTADCATFSSGVGGGVGYAGCNIARDTSGEAMDIDGCLQVTMESPGGDGNPGYVLFGTYGGSYVAGHTLVYSTYVRPASVACTVKPGLYLTGTGGSLPRTAYGPEVTCQPDQWTRVVVSATFETGVTGASVAPLIEEASADSGAVFYADHQQLEFNDCTYWIAGGSSYSGAPPEILVTDTVGNPFGADYDQAWSINAWVRRGGGSGTGLQYLVYAGLSGDAGACACYCEPVNDLYKWSVTGMTAALQVTLDDYAWHMVTHVAREDAAEQAVYQLWLDGVLVDTETVPATGTALLHPSTWEYLYVGSNSSNAYNWTGPMAQVLIVPFALTATTIASLYNSGAGAALGPWPRHTISGDIVGDRPPVQAYARVKQVDPVDYVDATGTVQAGGALTVTLVEV
jgi:hypothetical protein